MKKALRLLTVSAVCISSAGLSQSHPALRAPSPVPVLPNPDQLGFNRTSGVRCFGSFDLAVTAIETGFSAEGVQCLQRAASRGDVRAIRAIGLMLQNGVLLERSQEAATSWFYEAALRGDAHSMYLLGEAFQKGLGVEADARLAEYWLRRASEKGYVPPA